MYFFLFRGYFGASFQVYTASWNLLFHSAFIPLTAAFHMRFIMSHILFIGTTNHACCVRLCAPVTGPRLAAVRSRIVVQVDDGARRTARGVYEGRGTLQVMTDISTKGQYIVCK